MTDPNATLQFYIELDDETFAKFKALLDAERDPSELQKLRRLLTEPTVFGDYELSDD